jgi:hypothetical protein
MRRTARTVGATTIAPGAARTRESATSAAAAVAGLNGVDEEVVAKAVLQMVILWGAEDAIRIGKSVRNYSVRRH